MGLGYGLGLGLALTCVRGKWPHPRSTNRLPKVSGLRRK